MEQILVEAWVMLIGLLLVVIGMTLVGYMKGHEKGYEQGRRDERIKNYKAMQKQKAHFIDAD